MSKSYKPRRKFDREFKKEALRMILEDGIPMIEVARKLDVHKGLLHKWKKELEKDSEEAFPGNGRRKSSEDEMRRLKQELKDIKEERDILKKALAIFSRQPGKNTDL